MSLTLFPGRRPFTRMYVSLFLAFLIMACGSFDWWSKKEIRQGVPESLYQRGLENYRKGRYEKAIEDFQKLKEEYPLSKFAIMAELGIADSYFSDEKYIEAESSYNDFLNLHPTNTNLPYVIYQLGMCHYHQMMSIDRDQTETLRAKKEFERLIALYPTSQFSFMAEKMLRECKQRLGEHEFYVGRFYFKSKKYKAALKRFENVARDYPNMGLDYRVSFFIHETKRLIDLEEKEKAQKEKELKAKNKNSKKI
ncbi:MAG: outer membrane protein assembly factor BamD [Syntrophales bacterium]